MNHGEIVRFRPRFSVTEPISAALEQIERASEFLRAAGLSEGWLDTVRSRALLLEAHHTTRLDGVRLTLEQAEHALAGRPVPEAGADDTRALLNYREARAFGAGCGSGPLAEDHVREIHRRLEQGLRGGAGAGAYRAVDGYVVDRATRRVLYAAPPAAEVPALVRALVAWCNDGPEVHPVVAAAIVQWQLAHIHPFLGGNGRASRLLSVLALDRAGCGGGGLVAISQHYDGNRRAFQRARQGVRDAGMDLTGWLEFFADGLARQLRAVRAQAEEQLRRDAAARHGLSERQAVAVEHVLEEGRLTIAALERLCPGADRRALQRELKQLVDRGLLRQTRTRNRVQYLAGKRLD
jgi:Fic family protein